MRRMTYRDIWRDKWEVMAAMLRGQAVSVTYYGEIVAFLLPLKYEVQVSEHGQVEAAAEGVTFKPQGEVTLDSNLKAGHLWRAITDGAPCPVTMQGKWIGYIVRACPWWSRQLKAQVEAERDALKQELEEAQ